MKKTFLFLFGLCWLFANSQDSLPDFSVINKGNNRIVISWNNPYKITRQITIQRSEDSLTNFRSIVSVPDPMNRQNGYLDAKAPDDKMFYRLYIHVDGSYFLYSKSKRPVPEGFVPPKIFVSEKINTNPAVDSNLIKVLNKISTPQNAKSVYTPEEVLLLQKYKNNKLNKIADSTSRKIDLVLKLKSRPELILPMYRIVSNKEGLVQVNLNDFLEKKYSIRFYEEDSSFLFELKNIKVASFLLDKSNFHHAGWFKSELYDNGKLIETNRFFIPKDF